MQRLLMDFIKIDAQVAITYYLDATKRGLSLEEALHQDSLARAAEVVSENEKQKRQHLSIVA